MFSSYLSNQMGPGPTPTPTPGLDSQAGLWGNKARTFSGLWLPWQGQGWGSCTVPICPRLLRWWEVPQLAGGTWEKAVPPGSLA